MVMCEGLGSSHQCYMGTPPGRRCGVLLSVYSKLCLDFKLEEIKSLLGMMEFCRLVALVVCKKFLTLLYREKPLEISSTKPYTSYFKLQYNKIRLESKSEPKTSRLLKIE